MNVPRVNIFTFKPWSKELMRVGKQEFYKRIFKIIRMNHTPPYNVDLYTNDPRNTCLLDIIFDGMLYLP